MVSGIELYSLKDLVRIVINKVIRELIKGQGRGFKHVRVQTSIWTPRISIKQFLLWNFSPKDLDVALMFPESMLNRRCFRADLDRQFRRLSVQSVPATAVSSKNPANDF